MQTLTQVVRNGRLNKKPAQVRNSTEESPQEYVIRRQQRRGSAIDLADLICLPANNISDHDLCRFLASVLSQHGRAIYHTAVSGLDFQKDSAFSQLLWMASELYEDDFDDPIPEFFDFRGVCAHQKYSVRELLVWF